MLCTIRTETDKPVKLKNRYDLILQSKVSLIPMLEIRSKVKVNLYISTEWGHKLWGMLGTGAPAQVLGWAFSCRWDKSIPLYGPQFPYL